MVLGFLTSASLLEHKIYIGGRKRWSMRPPTKPTRVYKFFVALRRAVPKSQQCAARRNTWISEETWRIVDERVSAHRDPRKGKVLKRKLGRAVKAILAAYQKRRADEAVTEVEALVGADPPLIQEAWYRIQGCYKAAVDRAPSPARVTLERITAERVALYIRFPPPGDNIPVELEPFEVKDAVPEKGEIEWAVKRLRNNRFGGASRMRAEHIKGWLVVARTSEKGETSDTEKGGQEDRWEGVEN